MGTLRVPSNLSLSEARPRGGWGRSCWRLEERGKELSTGRSGEGAVYGDEKSAERQRGSRELRDMMTKRRHPAQLRASPVAQGEKVTCDRPGAVPRGGGRVRKGGEPLCRLTMNLWH